MDHHTPALFGERDSVEATPVKKTKELPKRLQPDHPAIGFICSYRKPPDPGENISFNKLE